MTVRSGDISVANLCGDLKTRRIRVNHEYQRQPKAWSTAARSYLIETILKGYPIPKIYLWQTTDIKTLRTDMEIVDGQQRVMAIQAFFQDELRISTSGEFKGKRFSDLDEEMQLRFLDYSVGTDTLAGATKRQVREVYRRINSYTTPLNAQEKRYAGAYGGEGSVKYFILDLADQFSDFLVEAKTFSEGKIGRMADQEWFAKVIDQFRVGIYTSNPKKLDDLYVNFDDHMLPDSDGHHRRFQGFFAWLHRNAELHDSKLSSPEQLMTLALAVGHCSVPSSALSDQGFQSGALRSDEQAVARLLQLAAVMDADLEEMSEKDPLRAFVQASTEATNTLKHRQVRMKYVLDAVKEA